MIRHRARLFAVAALATTWSLAQPLAALAGVDQAAPGLVSGSVRSDSARGAGRHDDALLVRFRPDVAATDIDEQFATAGATQVGRLDELGTRVLTAARGRSRAAVVRALLNSPAVASVEEDGVGQVDLVPNDLLWSAQWSQRKIHAPKAWDLTTGEGGAIIAILDTGVQRSHEDLAGRVLDGKDFVNGDANPADDMGHGTMVAGVAAGRGNNLLGVAGTCWSCRILPVKVANRSGAVRWSNAAAGIIWAVKHGADVINMSFGAKSGSSTLASAVQYALDNGVVVVASAGNSGNKTKFYPAAYPGVLSVAATSSTDRLYDWSTRGAWVRIAAPGCTWTTKRGGGWGSFCGTSASAPIIAGIAGLAFSLEPGATRGKVIKALTETAAHFTWRIGGGRADAYETVLRFQGGN